MATQELAISGGVVLPPMPAIDVEAYDSLMRICAVDMVECRSLVVSSKETYEQAVEIGKLCTARMKAIKAFIRGTVALSSDDNYSPLAQVERVKSALVAFETAMLAPYVDMDTKLKKQATDYRIEQNRIASEAAEQERQRRQREIENDRIAQAEAAEAKGATVLAEKLLSTPVATPKVEEKPVIEKGFAGASARKAWKFEIEKAADVPREFLCPDEKAIGEYVRKNKDKAAIPGVRIYSVDGTSW